MITSSKGKGSTSFVKAVNYVLNNDKQEDDNNNNNNHVMNVLSINTAAE